MLYISCATTFNTASYLSTDKWFLFASSTIIWILTQSLDGLTFLIFNRTIICSASTTLPVIHMNWIQTNARQ
ncbi:unnamed protein product [Brugia timori]|uniref:Uncharacterized protein n=1 Tax=Brugia timori TaxID=42155 RepID=A0A3P7VCF0_9BILA|nr:unnamed protein product [Brugia timori]